MPARTRACPLPYLVALNIAANGGDRIFPFRSNTSHECPGRAGQGRSVGTFARASEPSATFTAETAGYELIHLGIP